jgi:hypothetical protein
MADERDRQQYERERVERAREAFVQLGTQEARLALREEIIGDGRHELAVVALAWLHLPDVLLRLEAVEVDGIAVEDNGLHGIAIARLAQDVTILHQQEAVTVLLYDVAALGEKSGCELRIAGVMHHQTEKRA